MLKGNADFRECKKFCRHLTEFTLYKLKRALHICLTVPNHSEKENITFLDNAVIISKCAIY